MNKFIKGWRKGEIEKVTESSSDRDKYDADLSVTFDDLCEAVVKLQKRIDELEEGTWNDT